MKKLLSLFLITLLLFLAGCGAKSSSDDKSDETEKTNGNKTEESSDDTENDEDKSSDNVTEDNEDNTPDEITGDNEDNNTDAPTSDSTEDELKQAFADYLEEIKILAPEEGRLISLYDSVTGENYTDDETLYATLKAEIVPGYNKFVGNVEAIMPRNKEIRDAHEQYIEAINTQYSAFTLILSAIEEKDQAIITEANGKLSTARTIMRDYLYALDELAEKTGVTLE